MEFKQYQELALKTESAPARLEMHDIALLATLDMAIAATRALDLVKRKLYYGKNIDPNAMGQVLSDVNAVSGFLTNSLANDPYGTAINSRADVIDRDQLPPHAKNLNVDALNVRLLHSAIGSFTESGEKLEALREQLLGGTLDLVNLAEEFGDDNWYDAIGKDELTRLGAEQGQMINDATIRCANINKLQNKLSGRYSAGDFDVMAALNRNLAQERELLEKGVAA